MGYIRHHAIVVTSFDEALLDKVRAFANQLCPAQVTNTIMSSTNGYYSFFIGPDGSKSGWMHDEEGDKNRAKIIEFINSLAHSDCSNSVSYAELFYGDDEGEAEITNHN